MIADALDLAYRLPKLFACLHDGSVDAWRVRRVASATREFTLAQAGEADRRLSAVGLCGEPLLARVPRWRIQKILDQIRIVDDPDQAEKDRQANRNRRDLRIWPSGDGVASINGTLSVEDGMRLDQRLDQIVESLRFLGDERPSGMLRSVAAGILAEPDSLFTLFDQVDNARGTEPEPNPEPEAEPEPEPESGSDSENAADEPDAADDEQTEKSETPESEQTEESDTGERSAEKADPQAGGRPVPAAFRRPTQLPTTMLYIHFDRTWGTYSLDGVGAITRSEAQEILGHSKVTVRPVIDLETTITATGYVASPRLKEQTALLNGATCTFPSCDRPARVCDYDHIINHRDGGPTDSRNGHRLCRYHRSLEPQPVRNHCGAQPWESHATRPGRYLVTGGTTTRLPGRVETGQRRRKPDAA